MLELESQEQRIKAVSGEVSVRRDEHGVPVVAADDFPDAFYGLGLVQAFDRGMQMELTRLLARGQMSEHLPPDENFVAMDKTMRKYDIWGFSLRHAELLEEEELKEAEAFCRGGRCPVRPDNWIGVLPLPGWDEAYDWKGFYPPEKNPRLLNPEQGYFGTSNQDLNHLSDVHIQTMPMSDDRATRIAELLAERDDHSVESLKKMQYNVYGKHAERVMPLIRHLLPESGNGKLLSAWDLIYASDSVAASVFENVYFEIVRTVFGDYGVGREVIEYILDNTELYYMYYGQFDHVLQREESLWFGGKTRDEVFGEAVARGLEMEAAPFGSTRQVMMKNLVYGDMMPDFNYGPIEIIGCRGTVSQGAIFRAPGGRIATFSPTIRFISDMSCNKYYSCLAGGPSEKPTSPLYASGVEGWLAGDYKLIEP